MISWLRQWASGHDTTTIQLSDDGIRLAEPTLYRWLGHRGMLGAYARVNVITVNDRSLLPQIASPSVLTIVPRRAISLYAVPPPSDAMMEQ